jgi:hypothetical protein
MQAASLLLTEYRATCKFNWKTLQNYWAVMVSRLKISNAILAQVLAHNSKVVEKSQQFSKNGVAFKE